MAAYIAITVESRGGKETIGCGTMGGRCVPRETRGSDDTIGSAAMAGVGGAHCADGARQLRDYSLWHPAGALLTGRIPPCLGDGLLWDDGRAFGEQSGTQWPL